MHLHVPVHMYMYMYMHMYMYMYVRTNNCSRKVTSCSIYLARSGLAGERLNLGFMSGVFTCFYPSFHNTGCVRALVKRRNGHAWVQSKQNYEEFK